MQGRHYNMDGIFEQNNTNTTKDLIFELFSVWYIMFYLFCTLLFKAQNNLICKNKQINNFTVKCSQHMCFKYNWVCSNWKALLCSIWAHLTTSLYGLLVCRYTCNLSNSNPQKYYLNCKCNLYTYCFETES